MLPWPGIPHVRAMAFEMSLSCDDVCVQRAGKDVLAGVSLSLAPGEAVMLRGPNGSGKTSMLRAVAGLASFDGEIVFSRGVQVLDPAFIRAHEIHMVSPEGGLSPRLTVRETARFLGAFYGRDPGESLGQLGLEKQGHLRVGDLSTGQRRRLSLLRLLISPRALWLLDEPFAALDEEGKEIVRALIDIHRARGGLVMLALHDREALPSAKTLFVEAA
ncbi:heme ABC exporter ATP-binding protein CcmA [Parvularcula lutaonensis]|uniref:Heme ABC exporter ATP-binding protein CcmA n=1 Tax=Parvularcula lutaonensis TaxID=491923 RepID=A0ABV7MBA3_9PROT|nr:heme ABC exporter ATP-binding protein CcmA [Parvularcula lutaonensis]GGY47501.1 cytochrome c biogenesis ATP-binding export protein CcmA [Parvularcula lutaonensis]